MKEIPLSEELEYHRFSKFFPLRRSVVESTWWLALRHTEQFRTTQKPALNSD
jgi:hypothetical protein